MDGFHSIILCGGLGSRFMANAQSLENPPKYKQLAVMDSFTGRTILDSHVDGVMKLGAKSLSFVIPPGSIEDFQSYFDIYKEKYGVEINYLYTDPEKRGIGVYAEHIASARNQIVEGGMLNYGTHESTMPFPEDDKVFFSFGDNAMVQVSEVTKELAAETGSIGVACHYFNWGDQLCVDFGFIGVIGKFNEIMKAVNMRHMILREDISAFGVNNMEDLNMVLRVTEYLHLNEDARLPRIDDRPSSPEGDN